MNSIQVSGKFANPKFKTTNSGTKMATFGVADNQYKDGERKTQWINCVVFGKRAETIEKHSTNLDKITVNGKLNENTYEGKNGTVTNFNVLVNDFDLTFKKTEGADTLNTENLGNTSNNFTADDLPF